MWTQITCLANPNDEQGIPNPMRNTVNGGGGRRCRRHPSPCDSQVRKFRGTDSPARDRRTSREVVQRERARGSEIDACALRIYASTFHISL